MPASHTTGTVMTLKRLRYHLLPVVVVVIVVAGLVVVVVVVVVVVRHFTIHLIWM